MGFFKKFYTDGKELPPRVVQTYAGPTPNSPRFDVVDYAKKKSEDEWDSEDDVNEDPEIEPESEENPNDD